MVSINVRMPCGKRWRNNHLSTISSLCRQGDLESDSNSRVLAVAWLTLPWGAIASVVVYKVVIWWQGLDIPQDYARSIVVLGKAQT